MARYITLPDMTRFEILPGETPAAAFEAAARKYPEAFGIEQKHGFMEATKAGAKEGIGAGLRGLGSLTGSARLEQAGQSMLKPSDEPGAYKETTGEDVDTAFNKGILPGAHAWANKNIAEPLGGMIGRYAIPTAVGAGAALGAAALAPEMAAAGTIGAGLASGAGFVAADMPMEQGENLGRQDEVTRAAQEQGVAPPQFNQTETIAASLAQAALLPLLGGLGGKLVHPFLKTMGPDLAATARQVATGQLTKEQAIAQLNSIGKNILIKTTEAGAVGAPMMVGTEALRTAQSGEDVTGDPAMARYGESLKAAGAFAPLGGLIGGARLRSGQAKEIGKADEANTAMLMDARSQDKTNTQAAADVDAWKAAEQAKAEDEARWANGEAAQSELELKKGKGNVKGAQAYADSVTVEPESVSPISKGLFNSLGVPNKGKAAEIRNTTDIEELRTNLQATLENIGQTGSPAWAEKPGAAAKLQATLIKLAPEKAQVQTGFDFQTPEAPQAQEAARSQATAQETRGANLAQKPPTIPNATRDMFSGKQSAVDMREPEVAPSATPADLHARKADLFDQYQAAYDHYTKTGDDSQLAPIVAKAKELQAYDAQLNAASTKAMFDKNGQPTTAAKKGVDNAPRPAEQNADRTRGAGDGADLPGKPEQPTGAVGETEEAGVDGVRAGPSVPVHERSVVAEEPNPRPLEQKVQTTQQQIDTLALLPRTAANVRRMTKLLAQRVIEQRGVKRNEGVGALTIPAETKPGHGADQVRANADARTADHAAKEWDAGRSEEYTPYAELHPAAKDLLHTRIEMASVNKEGELPAKLPALVGGKFKNLFKDVQRKDDIEKLAEKSRDPDAFMYRSEGVAKVKRTDPGAFGFAEDNSFVHREAVAMVHRITKGWANAPTILVKEFKDLSAADQKRIKDNQAGGFYRPGSKEVVIVSDRNGSLKEVKATLFHETLGHFGLREAFRSELNTMLEQMYETNKALRAGADAVLKSSPELSKAAAVEEMLAESQIHGKVPQSVLAQIKTLLRAFARKMGVDLKWTDDDVAAVLRQAHKAVTKDYSKSASKGFTDTEELKYRTKKGSASVTAPAEPGNAKAEGPRVIAYDEVKKSIADRAKEFTETKGKGTLDYVSNKFLGKAHSLLGKLDRAGESGAWSKLLKGRVSAEFSNWQSNNAMTLVHGALDAGHLVIDKSGFAHTVEDKVHNIRTLETHYASLRDALKTLGYKDTGLDKNDPNTVTNAAAMALYGPRLHELVKNGTFDASFFTKADKAFSDELRAKPELKELIDKYHDTYNVMREKAIDNMVESGIYTEAKAKEYMDRAEYLPLYRMDEELQNTLGESSGASSLLAAAKEHHLGAGSDLGIGDPVENAFNNLAWLNTRAVKNNTAKILMESLIAAGSAHEQKFKGNAKDPALISFNVGGEPKFFRLDDVNDASAFLSAPVMTGLGWRVARDFTNVLRKGVTMMPGFVWGQASQDAQRVAIRTGQGFAKSYRDVAKSTINEMRGPEHESAAQKELRSAGVVAARDFVDGTESFRKHMLDKPDSLWHKTIEKLERMAAASDGASREAAYNAKIKELGDTPEGRLEAIHAARMLIDFNNRGNSRTLAALMTVVPFVNARIQGTHRMVDALHGKIPGVDKAAAQRMAVMQVGKLVAFTLAYSLVKQGDDEYENETTQGRNNNFMFPGGLKMPVASELLPFKVAAETVARQMLADPHEDFAKSRDSMASALGSLLMGPQDMVPIMGKPFLESLTNHSFSTGHELVGQSLQGKSSSEQFNTSTTAFAKAMSGGLQSTLETLGLPKGSGISPIVLENFLTGFTGRVGQELLNTARAGEALLGGDRAAPKINEIPLVGAMFMNPEGNAMRSDFQAVADKVAMAQKDLKALKDSGDFKGAQEYQKENQALLSLHGRIVPLQQRLTALSKRAKMGEHSEEKRDAIYQQQMQVLKQVMELREIAAPWL